MTTALESPLETLAAAVAAVAEERVENWSTHALGDELVGIRRQIDRLEAQFIRRLEHFDRGQGALAEGAASTVSWLRGTCGLTGAAAVDRVRVARVLADLPETTASFHAGHAPYANVSLIARLAEDVGIESTLTVEHTLVEAAEKLDAGRMRLLTSCTRHHLDADGALDEDNRNHERRWFSCDQTYGGVFVVRGELDAEGGALVKTALDALSAPAGPGDERLATQRRADAVVELAARQLQAGGLPGVHGQRPHLMITVAAEALQRDVTAPLAELRGVGPIHVETARRLACDASLTIATVSGDKVAATSAGAAEGTVALSVGRASRTIPAPMRAALSLRDKGCRFPGCDRPPEWTDGHHVRHWADHGPTRVDNLVLLCRRHHRMVHEHGWTLRLSSDGTVTVEEPEPRRARAP